MKKKVKKKNPSFSVSRGHYYKISTTVCLVNFSGKKIKHCRVCPSLILHLIIYLIIITSYLVIILILIMQQSPFSLQENTMRPLIFQ